MAVDCPYCGKKNEICHDDGFGYEEDRAHEMECRECEKNFVFHTSIMFLYESQKADCLNGEKHQLVASNTYPRRHSRMQCTSCDYSEKLPKGHPYLSEPKFTI